MNLNIIFKMALPLIFLSGCSSLHNRDVSKGTCTLKKHPTDNLFQVLQNKRKINQDYYIYEEASEIRQELIKQNKCHMP